MVIALNLVGAGVTGASIVTRKGVTAVLDRIWDRVVEEVWHLCPTQRVEMMAMMGTITSGKTGQYKFNSRRIQGLHAPWLPLEVGDLMKPRAPEAFYLIRQLPAGEVQRFCLAGLPRPFM
jgi:hypothetical protein